MKVAIFSDSHDNEYNIDIFVKWVCNVGVDKIICCGDISRVETLDCIVKQYSKEVHFVTGNADEDDDFMEIAKSISGVSYYKRFGELDIEGIRIAFVHYPGEAKKLAKTGKYDYVFYGHTHVPWKDKVDNCYVVNPGTLAGMFYRATFAIFDTETRELELKLVEKL